MTQVTHDPRVQDASFDALGTTLRLAVVAEDRAPGDELVAQIQQLIAAADRALSRFIPDSELRLLEQRGGRQPVGVSRLLAAAVAHAVEAAQQSGGLIDPTMGGAMEAAGYADRWDPARRLPLTTMLADAPPRRAAAPHPDAAWRGIWVDRATRQVRLPAGLRLDLGATAKGLLADLALRLVGPAELAIVDLGGDLAIAGTSLAATPTPVLAADPFGGEPRPLSLHAPGGVATSSIAGRCWRGAAGAAHHLLDPSTGQPAFTGLVQVTAAAPSAAQAEVIAGHALLSGPDGAQELVGRFGGVLVHDDGSTKVLNGDLLTAEQAA